MATTYLNLDTISKYTDWTWQGLRRDFRIGTFKSSISDVNNVNSTTV